MRLINKLSKMSYGMKKVGPYAQFEGEFRVKKKEHKLEWTCRIEVPQAVLIGPPAVEVLEASNEARELLKKSSLTLEVDGEPVISNVPLLDKHLRPSANSELHCWFDSSEEGMAPGIFIVNNSIVKATVSTPSVIPAGHVVPRIKISIDADIYQSTPGDVVQLKVETES